MASNSPNHVHSGQTHGPRISSGSPSRSQETAATNTENEAVMCVICLDTENFQEIKDTACGHSFHKDCFLKWLQYRNYCPLCRSSLPSSVQELGGNETNNVFSQAPQNVAQEEPMPQEQLRLMQEIRSPDPQVNPHLMLLTVVINNYSEWAIQHSQRSE